MTQFYYRPALTSVPQSEPTEIAALKMQNQRMREMLKELEWIMFPSMALGGPPYWGCEICDAYGRDKIHKPDCKLAALLKETE